MGANNGQYYATLSKFLRRHNKTQSIFPYFDYIETNDSADLEALLRNFKLILKILYVIFKSKPLRSPSVLVYSLTAGQQHIHNSYTMGLALILLGRESWRSVPWKCYASIVLSVLLNDYCSKSLILLKRYRATWAQPVLENEYEAEAFLILINYIVLWTTLTLGVYLAIWKIITVVRENLHDDLMAPEWAVEALVLGLSLVVYVTD